MYTSLACDNRKYYYVKNIPFKEWQLAVLREHGEYVKTIDSWIINPETDIKSFYNLLYNLDVNRNTLPDEIILYIMLKSNDIQTIFNLLSLNSQTYKLSTDNTFRCLVNTIFPDYIHTVKDNYRNQFIELYRNYIPINNLSAFSRDGFSTGDIYRVEFKYKPYMRENVDYYVITKINHLKHLKSKKSQVNSIYFERVNNFDQPCVYREYNASLSAKLCTSNNLLLFDKTSKKIGSIISTTKIMPVWNSLMIGQCVYLMYDEHEYKIAPERLAARSKFTIVDVKRMNGIIKSIVLESSNDKKNYFASFNSDCDTISDDSGSCFDYTLYSESGHFIKRYIVSN